MLALLFSICVDTNQIFRCHNLSHEVCSFSCEGDSKEADHCFAVVLGTSLERIRSYFDEADVNQNGEIDFDEFKHSVQKELPSTKTDSLKKNFFCDFFLHCLDVSETDLRKIFDAIDRDGSSLLTFDEMGRKKTGKTRDFKVGKESEKTFLDFFGTF